MEGEIIIVHPEVTPAENISAAEYALQAAAQALSAKGNVVSALADLDDKVDEIDEAIENAEAAARDADTATRGAENVNATLNGTTLTITNRNGVSTSVNTKGEKGDTGATGQKGEKGDPFVYSDFTSSQLANLKGAKGDPGLTQAEHDAISQAETNRQYFEGLRDDAEEVRGTNEQGRITAEEARKVAEGSDDPDSDYYDVGRCANERARNASFTQAISDAEGAASAALEAAASAQQAGQQASTKIGDLSTLNTENKSNVVGAVNEVNTNVLQLGASAGQMITQLQCDLGDKSQLTTDAKNNLVAAINEVDGKTDEFQSELAGKAAQSDVETLQTDVETLQTDLAEITGGEVSLEVEYKTGAILNTSGNLTTLAGYKYAQVDLEGYEGSTVHVKTTTGNQYIALWSLSAEEFVIGTAGTVIAKGNNCSVSKEADIDLSLYPSARYLYIGCYSASTVATATVQTPNRVDALEAKTGEMRYAMNIKKTDSDCDIYVKMLRAYRMGNTDVFFEKADYAISDMYVYVRDVLHINMGSYAGLPIGNNCRYYFNGSKLTATRPEGYDGVFNILDAKGVGGNFELYDVELVCIDGHYCIHDEAASSRVPYLHKYENVVARFVTTQGAVNGCKPIGGGTGYDATVEMTNCSFLSNNTDTVIAYHGPSARTETSGSAKFRLRISGCHLSNGISFNQTYFHEDDDNTFFYCNNYHYYAPINTDVFGTVVMKDNNVGAQIGEISTELAGKVENASANPTESIKIEADADIDLSSENINLNASGEIRMCVEGATDVNLGIDSEGVRINNKAVATTDQIPDVSGKVDKETGKGLIDSNVASNLSSDGDDISVANNLTVNGEIWVKDPAILSGDVVIGGESSSDAYVIIATEKMSLGDIQDVEAELGEISTKISEIAEDAKEDRRQSDTLGDASAHSMDLHSPITICGEPLILYGNGAPSANTIPDNWNEEKMGRWVGMPSFIGQMYINTSASSNVLWIAVNNTATSGWKQA